MTEYRGKMNQLKLRRAAERKARRANAYDFENDGETVRVEYTRDDGERVIALYTRMGWARPPAALCADFDRRLNQPPQTILYPKAIGRMRGHLPPEEPGEER